MFMYMSQRLSLIFDCFHNDVYIESSFHNNNVRWVFDQKQRAIEQSINKLNFQAIKKDDGLMKMYPVFVAVLFGAIYNHSIQSMIDMKGDFLNTVLKHYQDCYIDKTVGAHENIIKNAKKQLSKLHAKGKFDDASLESINTIFDNCTKDFKQWMNHLTLHEIPAQYKHYKSIEDIIDSLADVIREELYSEVKKSSDYNILVDKSTDIATVKRLILYATYFPNDAIDYTGCNDNEKNSNGKVEIEDDDVAHADGVHPNCPPKPKTVFMDLFELTNETADGIKSSLDICADNIGLNKSKCAFYGSDGAVVIKVADLLKNDWNDLMENLHCLAHSTALGTKDVQNEDTSLARRLNEIDGLINDIVNFFRKSAKSTGFV